MVAFTATQIPHIEDRRYPASLAGPLYPEGHSDPTRGRAAGHHRGKHGPLEVVFAYSDVSYEYVMHQASWAMTPGLRLHAPRPGQHRRSRAGSRSSPSARCAPAPARARPPAGSCELLRSAAGKKVVDPPSRCPTATSGSQACSASPRSPTSTGTSAPSRRGRSTSRTSTRGSDRLRRRRLRGHPRARRRRKPTSSSGTAATTTSPSIKRRPAHRRGRSAPPRPRTRATTRARRTCAWPTSSSSTRSSRPSSPTSGPVRESWPRSIRARRGHARRLADHRRRPEP